MKQIFKVLQVFCYPFRSSCVASPVPQSKQHFSEENETKEFGIRDLFNELLSVGIHAYYYRLLALYLAIIGGGVPKGLCSGVIK